MDQICAARIALERLAIPDAVKNYRRSPGPLSQLDRIIATMERAAEALAWMEVSQADLSFHREICRTSENAVVLTLWESLARHVLIVLEDRQPLAMLVARDAGEPLQSALVIEEVLDGGAAHALFSQEIENDARIQLSRPRPHRQAIEGGEAHRAFDTLSRNKRAHGSTAAEMGDEDASGGNLGGDFWKPVGDVFVRKAVEAITTHALAMEVLGNGEAVGNIRMSPVKSCVEACNLR